jgi:hypothetical protein
LNAINSYILFVSMISTKGNIFVLNENVNYNFMNTEMFLQSSVMADLQFRYNTPQTAVCIEIVVPLTVTIKL